ncbi:hypothetical protein L6164_014705 [Bauhinia variegata]|uniref:Uncharacterized protein n=1 Tax=Bauhinia variegata TaxID=167791 RepID=A0ACB9NJL9_BAUVA|nr:hypothetical protein L6164_014705 [Bauhinia variegata]
MYSVTAELCSSSCTSTLISQLVCIKEGVTMAGQSLDLAIQGLKELLREKEELNEVAVAKIEKLVDELQRIRPPFLDPVVINIRNGFNEFKINKFDKNPDLYNKLAEGQNPKYLVFACSDSRVSPTYTLNFQPGDAFMVRNIANMVPQFDQIRYSGTGAAIEYAINALHVPNILVIGHSRCGGIKRLMELPQDDAFDFIDDWVKIGLPAKVKVLDEFPNYDFYEQCKFCELVSVYNSLENLRTYPYVVREEKENRLRLYGGYYDFVKGEFSIWKHERPIIPRPPILPPRPL